MNHPPTPVGILERLSTADRRVLLSFPLDFRQARDLTRELELQDMGLIYVPGQRLTSLGKEVRALAEAEPVARGHFPTIRRA